MGRQKVVSGVGIDLGTTNCAVAYVPLSAPGSDGPGAEILPIHQIIRPGEVAARPLLPSFLYLPGEREVPASSLDLPWAKGVTFAVGAFARDQGAKMPSRLVASAKSWLCHGGVDRRGAILPWKAPEGVARISPVDASTRYLEHLTGAWRSAGRGDLAEQRVVLAVPASFDAVARELTVEAAARAGIPEPILLEEPQAALYAWIGGTGGAWREQAKVGDVILVCDVGGGTTDFSLIAVSDEQGDLALTRVAVGEHILLGGDNMDLALAHAVRGRMASEGTKLDSWQFLELTHACRGAKESLLGTGEQEGVPIAIQGRSSRLVGGTLRASISRAEAEAVLLDGFAPMCAASARPKEGRSVGLAEWGLSYAADTSITAHLASFLGRHAGALAGLPGAAAETSAWAGFAVPTAVLFNGGVFRSAALRERVMTALGSWVAAAGGEPPKELGSRDLDRAVAQGGASYAWVREGHGIRIRGGTARAYYVGVEAAVPAVPGLPPPVDAVCVAPFGMEEGSHEDLPAREFGVVVGEQTEFRFFASSTRRDDRVGTIIDSWAMADADLVELPPMRAVLEGQGTGQLVPVHLRSLVTEVGTLQVFCLERGGPGRWKLEFDVRGAVEARTGPGG